MQEARRRDEIDLDNHDKTAVAISLSLHEAEQEAARIQRAKRYEQERLDEALSLSAKAEQARQTAAAGRQQKVPSIAAVRAASPRPSPRRYVMVATSRASGRQLYDMCMPCCRR